MSLKHRVQSLEGRDRFIRVEDLIADLEAEDQGETPKPRTLPLHSRLVRILTEEDEQ